MTAGSDWTIRAGVPEDEGCLVSMWLKGYAHSRDARESGYADAREDGSPDEIAFWRVHQPIVTSLVRRATVRVACDPARSTYEPGRPAVIWAWTCSSPGMLHWVAVKRSVVRLLGADVAREMVADLLGADMHADIRVMFDLVDLRPLNVNGEKWKRDRRWINALRSLSARVLDGDALLHTVALDILDEDREEWQPNNERAA